MRNDIQISAIIPTFNRGHIISKAIESILAQRHAPAEIIVVDDGSNDQTRGVVEGYGGRVRYFFQENSGVSAARNRGVREAGTDWIAFLDSDDCWLPDHLERIANAIDITRGSAALYFSDTLRPHEDGGRTYWDLCSLEIDGPLEFKRDASEWALMPIHPMMLQASVIQRLKFVELGGFPEQLRTREDTLLFFELALLYPACAVSGCGAVMNSEDTIRLTRLYGAESSIYWTSTIFLYRYLIEVLTNVSPECRQFLIDSLSASYVSTGRVSFRRKQYLEAMKNLFSGCITSKSTFSKEVCSSLVRHLFKTNRKASFLPMRSRTED